MILSISLLEAIPTPTSEIVIISSKSAFLFIGDIFLERYSGTNLFGWGANEINGVPQVYGDRVLSFFITVFV